MSLNSRRDVPHGVPTDVSVSRPATVLVVEPDAVLRQFLRRLFERHGLEVLLTASPDEALVVLARAHGSVHAVVHTEALRFGAEQRETGHVAALSPDVPVVTFGGASAAHGANGSRPGGGPFDAEELARAVLSAIHRAR
jgi:CheY-like chemotaxis protein